MQRLISAFVGAAIILLAVWYAGMPLLFLTGVIVIFGIGEAVELLFRVGFRPSLALAEAGGLILLAGAYLHPEGYPGAAVTLLLFLNFMVSLFFYPRYRLSDLAATVFAPLYIGLLYYFYWISALDSGWVYLIFLFTATWACDTFAFVVGRNFGRVRFIPELSPKKTFEGTLAGIIGSVLVGCVFAYLYPFLVPSKIILLALMLGITAFLGDLMASSLKRQAGVKDSGTIIPGHGGVLDRFDSLLFTAPLVYYYAVLLIP